MFLIYVSLKQDVPEKDTIWKDVLLRQEVPEKDTIWKDILLKQEVPEKDTIYIKSCPPEPGNSWKKYNLQTCFFEICTPLKRILFVKLLCSEILQKF